MIAFWKHSLAVAVTSKNIAQKAGVESPDNGNSGFMMNIHLADILVNSYQENPDCTIDMGAMHPEVVKFLMAQMEDSSDWYANLSDEIEKAHASCL